MSPKTTYLKFGLLLTSLALLPPGSRAMAADLVPFEGQETGAFISDVKPFAFPLAYDRATGTGTATQIGNYTVSGDFVANVVLGKATGTFTMTAANGDMLFLDAAGGVVPTDHSKVVWDFTVTGGTGRFEQETGSFIEQLQLSGVVGSTSPNPYVATLKGAISQVPESGSGCALIAVSSLTGFGLLIRGRKTRCVGV
jgi:hypothetical protein